MQPFESQHVKQTKIFKLFIILLVLVYLIFSQEWTVYCYKTILTGTKNILVVFSFEFVYVIEI